MRLACLQLRLSRGEFGRRGRGWRERVERRLRRFADGRTERADERVARGLLVLGKLNETRHAEAGSDVSGNENAVREKNERTEFHGLA